MKMVALRCIGLGPIWHSQGLQHPDPYLSTIGCYHLLLLLYRYMPVFHHLWFQVVQGDIRIDTRGDAALRILQKDDYRVQGIEDAAENTAENMAENTAKDVAAFKRGSAIQAFSC